MTMFTNTRADQGLDTMLIYSESQELLTTSALHDQTSLLDIASPSQIECPIIQTIEKDHSCNSHKERKKREISPATDFHCTSWMPKRQRPPAHSSTSACDVHVNNFESQTSETLVGSSIHNSVPSSRDANGLSQAIHLGQFENSCDEMDEAAVTDEELVDAISAILENICAINKCRMPSIQYQCNGSPFRSTRYPDGSSSIFFSLQKPTIQMRYYISRLVKYMQVSKSAFVVALIYLDRVHAADEILAINDLNVHRLITTALTIACKFLEDEVHRNSTVSRIGGVPSTAEMNLLETQFLRRINWNCSVTSAHYELYRVNIFNRNPDFSLFSEICPSTCSESPSDAESMSCCDDDHLVQDRCEQCEARFRSDVSDPRDTPLDH